MKIKQFVFVFVVLVLTFSLAGCSGPSGRLLLDGGFMYGYRQTKPGQNTVAEKVQGTPNLGFRFVGQEENGTLVFQDWSNPQLLEVGSNGKANFIPFTEKYPWGNFENGPYAVEIAFRLNGENYLLEQEWTRQDPNKFPGLDGLNISRISDTKQIMTIDFTKSEWGGKKVWIADPKNTNLSDIILSEGEDNHGKLIIYNPQTGASPLSSYGNDQENPVFSPNGKEVMYETDPWTAASCVRKKNLETGTDVALFCGKDDVEVGNSPYGKWSPDGIHIVIALNNLFRSSDTMSFVILDNAGGTTEVKLPEYSEVDGMEWSPNGKYLAVLIIHSGDNVSEEISIFNTAGQNLGTTKYPFTGTNSMPNSMYWIK